MSRTLPQWVGRTDDAIPPPRVKARVIAAQDGVCACGCGVRLGMAGERIEFDHRLALILDGKNDEANLQALRPSCHRAKTDGDVAQKSIEARKRNKHLGIQARKAVIPGSKASGFKRKIDGTTERRQK